ncbi:MAG: DNA-binding response regulator [Chloroflexi bacterium RBG_16_57_8]|nr:MAG: DNA-binding response regulator [Chloroflexi bacterium RBG_16_57_8]
MLKILIADDHPVFRRGLRQIINEAPDMAVADEAVDGLEVLRKVNAEEYDAVVLDIAMPGKDGLDVLAHVRRERPRLPVLMLSMHPEEQYAVRALRMGASGYLTKESATEELVAAIRKVASGGRYVSSALAERLAAVVQQSAHVAHESLSDREYQIMRFIASGKTVSEIAHSLSLSVKTVSTYRVRILSKMKLKNNAELVRYAMENRLVD